MTWNTAFGIAGLVLAAAGCSSSSSGGTTTDFSGDYTVAVATDNNDCQFSGFTAGDTASGVPFTVTQSAADVTGVIGGSLAKVYYDVALGSHTFTGLASDNHVSMVIHGTNSFKQQSCTYTVIATLSGTLSGDSLAGQIAYSAATNGSADCAPLGACSTLQSFNGSRPPKQ